MVILKSGMRRIASSTRGFFSSQSRRLASCDALSSSRSTGMCPCTTASSITVHPAEFFTFTSKPASSSSCTAGRLCRSTAMCPGVLPRASSRCSSDGYSVQYRRSAGMSPTYTSSCILYALPSFSASLNASSPPSASSDPPSSPSSSLLDPASFAAAGALPVAPFAVTFAGTSSSASKREVATLICVSSGWNLANSCAMASASPSPSTACLYSCCVSSSAARNSGANCWSTCCRLWVPCCWRMRCTVCCTEASRTPERITRVW
mmetsp:Transcript_26424/g.68204  ORF Transcript_26424/g.68204 Transcript_26424/m.68204 type:complete len:263 (+) Transcript_26424:1145-1933(+)